MTILRRAKTTVVFSLIGLFSVGTQSARAEMSRGPYLTVDRAAAGGRDQIRALLPLMISENYGSLALKIDADHAKLCGTDGTIDHEALGLGLAYSTRLATSDTDLFGYAVRIASTPLSGGPTPGGEFLAGFGRKQLTWFYQRTEADRVSGHAMIQVRHFPGHTRFIPIVGETIESDDDSWEVYVPSHIIYSRYAADQTWRYYGGARVTSIVLPILDASPEQSGSWVDGYTAAIVVGYRHHVWGPLYIGIETGAVKHAWRIRSDAGKILSVDATPVGAFGRLGIETWFAAKPATR